ncbi:transcriptional regulator, TetR family [Stackebrandtia nassauensis DSM 44728]|uniref:Transcriptional regulator, TetR family n=1 Tax=Stackebrandtia nassauensis (strain DSM 44728 / CIP 108903 / NRRL B-16338 / NBRC 102104 / LLR-40K-21) TaxID=446470 RepID=D3PXD1_STANL|nr:transcriptional regulator, TetR family [Stackebrandtia nassauensis DSM 44728]
MTDVDIPVELRRLWRIPADTNLGRTAELDVERVVRTAVDLADRHGLDGVSLPKIAKTLGFTTMSLYRHVGSKEELLTLMFDAAFADFPEPATEPGQWRLGLHTWTAQQRDLYDRRPWLVRMPILAPPTGPHQVAFMDGGLRLLRPTGLEWPQKVGVLMLLTGWARHAAQLSHDLAAGREASVDQGAAERAWSRSLAHLVEPDRFPDMAALLDSDTFLAPRPETTAAEQADFVFGLERILDGVAELIASRARP